MIASTILFSCSQSDKDYHVNFSKVPQIKVNTEIAGFNDCLYPKDIMHTQDSILVVYEPIGDEYYIKIYNTGTKKLMNHLCHRGESPEDFINPRFIQNMDTSNTSFIIGDIHRICRFNIDSITDESYTGQDILRIPVQLNMYNYLFMLNDKIILYSQTGEHSITEYNRTDEKLQYIDIHPDYLTEEISPLNLNMEIYDATYFSNNKLIIKAYKNWNQIDLIDINSFKVKSLLFPDHLYNKKHYIYESSNHTAYKDPDAKTFFTKVKSTTNYIYALNWNAKPTDIKNGETASIIYKLDLQGNPIASYVFDCPVSNFSIDNKSEDITYLIGIADDGEIHILKPIKS